MFHVDVDDVEDVDDVGDDIRMYLHITTYA
jgi:hypothetical protein